MSSPRAAFAVQLGILLAAVIAAAALDAALPRVRPSAMVLHALAAVFCLRAAATFDRGDPPRVPWILAACAVTATLASQEVLGLPSGLRATVLVVANGLWVGFVATLVGIVRRSGLAEVATGSVRLITGSFAVAAAIVLALSVAIDVQRAALSGVTPDHAAFVRLALRSVSLLADFVVFTLGLYLVRMVLPMRSGSIAGPYLLVSASAAVFLALDLALVLSDLARYSELDAQLAVSAAVACGWSLLILAARAQARLIVAIGGTR